MTLKLRYHPHFDDFVVLRWISGGWFEYQPYAYKAPQDAFNALKKAQNKEV